MERAETTRSGHSRDLLSFASCPVEHLLLPVALFSPLWLQRDQRERCAAAPYRDFTGFFRPFGWFHRRPAKAVTLNTFFSGAFTYHWHGQWAAAEHADSYAGWLDLGFIGDREALPHLQQVAVRTGDALEELEAAVAGLC